MLTTGQPSLCPPGERGEPHLLIEEIHRRLVLAGMASSPGLSPVPGVAIRPITHRRPVSRTLPVMPNLGS